MNYITKFTQVTLISLLTLTSCKNEKVSIKEFPSSQKLKGTPLTTVKPYCPHKIMVEDSLLIIINRIGDYFFQVYDTKNMNLLVEFGNKGRGPGEFNEPTFINKKKNIEGKIYNLIYDTGSKRISYINFNDFVKDKTTVIKQEKLPKKMGDPDSFVFYSDTLAITAPGDGGGGRFQLFGNEKTKTTAYIPELPFKVHEDNYYPIYVTKSSLINIEKKKFVATVPMLGQYDFFDFSGNLLYSSIIHRNENLKKTASSSMEVNKSVKLFYQTELKNVGNLIYSIYYKYKSNEGSFSTTSRIHIFDWDGNLVKEYLLDKLILSFAYDDFNNCFYGIAPYEEEHQIIKYDLENSGMLQVFDTPKQKNQMRESSKNSNDEKYNFWNTQHSFCSYFNSH
ncbi:MAG: BF3164 family lipoprotein [Lachnospirales bacterium]